MVHFQYKSLSYLTDQEIMDHMLIYWDMDEEETFEYRRLKTIITTVTQKDYTCYPDITDVIPIDHVPESIIKFTYEIDTLSLRVWQDRKLPVSMRVELHEIGDVLGEWE